MGDLKKCENCGKDININIRICPFCAGEVEDRLECPLFPACPRCKVPLNLHTEDGEEYEVCPRCGGFWLSRTGFHHATKESDVYAKENTRAKYFRGPIKNRVTYIPCVRCGKLMNRKNFARISGVIVDECATHGVWLDAGELEKIRLFVVDGGLERAQDKRIEQVATELRALAIKAQDTAFLFKLLHFWNFKRWLFGG